MTLPEEAMSRVAEIAKQYEADAAENGPFLSRLPWYEHAILAALADPVIQEAIRSLKEKK